LDDRTTQQANLGCGTLILIAVIVLIFSGRGTGEIKDEVKQLRQTVASLEAKIDAQQTILKGIENKMAVPARGG
jgi:cell division protein FtsL